MNKIPCVVSKKGVVCLWEWGGLSPERMIGLSILIASASFEKKRAIYLKKEVNGNHALIPVQTGDFYLKIQCINGENKISLSSLIVDVQNKEVYSEVFKNISVSNYSTELMKRFLRAGIDKAAYLNCDKPFWVTFK